MVAVSAGPSAALWLRRSCLLIIFILEAERPKRPSPGATLQQLPGITWSSQFFWV